jgi:hypothetical protein
MSTSNPLADSLDAMTDAAFSTTQSVDIHKMWLPTLALQTPQQTSEQLWDENCLSRSPLGLFRNSTVFQNICCWFPADDVLINLLELCEVDPSGKGRNIAAVPVAFADNNILPLHDLATHSTSIDAFKAIIAAYPEALEKICKMEEFSDGNGGYPEARMRTPLQILQERDGMNEAKKRSITAFVMKCTSMFMEGDLAGVLHTCRPSPLSAPGESPANLGVLVRFLHVDKPDSAVVEEALQRNDAIHYPQSHRILSDYLRGKPICCDVCEAIKCADGKPLKLCACRSISYCGKECQAVAWKEHKQVCGLKPDGSSDELVMKHGKKENKKQKGREK